MTTSLDQLQSGQFAGARQLKLACGLTEFPRAIFDLADTLEVLDLSGNALSTLPDDLARLSKLRIIFASNNQFTELPEVLGECAQLSMVGFKANRIRVVSGRSLPPKLRWLILTDNAIETLPAKIGHCSLLQKLMLAGNRLRTLPDAMSSCSRLELIRLSANRLRELPGWLLRLPRLAWLAYAGNPFAEALERAPSSAIDTQIADVHWDALTLERQLGEGASGVIYRAARRLDNQDETPQPVALKLFKGAVTSDGLPECEMAACIRAGHHPNLVRVIGNVKQHPMNEHGLVMALIDPTFANLAAPPSLESCTRDRYAADARFDLASVLRLAYGIATAARHLHARGIMHGDLYAHNILHGGAGRALLGDFGAASFYDVDDAALGFLLQRLEVRAFGYLLEELIERCEEGSSPAVREIEALAAACLSEDVGSRPSFDAIAGRLRNCEASF
ncbi:leucine-rich repeat-containing serine/threonine-protein kinase [Trinickia sp. LjRoot230]|uniref:leucine-rich repeat-containing protein kinase family protein n=1 Tax=Trinickia sp. LjRoot230 TaxID=3342288 RepID=UPI003ECEBE38